VAEVMREFAVAGMPDQGFSELFEQPILAHKSSSF
jgi:hypothetical protein